MATYHGDLNATAHVRFHNPHQKSILVAYLLWFFLGGLAAHRFYLGYTRSGIAMVLFFAAVLVVGIAAFLTPILPVGLAIWGLWVLADGVMIPFMAR